MSALTRVAFEANDRGQYVAGRYRLTPTGLGHRQLVVETPLAWWADPVGAIPPSSTPCCMSSSQCRSRQPRRRRLWGSRAQTGLVGSEDYFFVPEFSAPPAIQIGGTRFADQRFAWRRGLHQAAGRCRAAVTITGGRLRVVPLAGKQLQSVDTSGSDGTFHVPVHSTRVKETGALSPSTLLAIRCLQRSRWRVLQSIAKLSTLKSRPGTSWPARVRHHTSGSAYAEDQ